MTIRLMLSLLLFVSALNIAQSESLTQADLYINEAHNVDRSSRILELERIYQLNSQAKWLEKLLLGEWRVEMDVNGEKHSLRYRFVDNNTFEIYEHVDTPARVLEWDITPASDNECCYQAPIPDFLFWHRQLSNSHNSLAGNDNQWWALPVREITGEFFKFDAVTGNKVHPPGINGF